jgi:hypothetical protein
VIAAIAWSVGRLCSLMEASAARWIFGSRDVFTVMPAVLM